MSSVTRRRVDQCDDDGFKKVERKKKYTSRNLSVTAPTGNNYLLRLAVSTTVLCVSLLYYSTESADIVEYIGMKGSTTLRVERLGFRQNVNFDSFLQ